MNYVKEFQYGDHLVTLKTGIIARKATSSVIASMGDTVLLVSVVMQDKQAIERSFLPLTVNYYERYYANGKIPGGFIKREGRPSTQEILISRLIDRAIRPLFPSDFNNEIQIIVTLMSLDPNIKTDVIALIGVSAALEISKIPFKGILGCARVGYINNICTLNPTVQQLENSELDLVVAATQSSVVMVESEAKILPSEIILDAIAFGHKEIFSVIEAIQEFAFDVTGNTKHDREMKFVCPSFPNLQDKISESLYLDLKQKLAKTFCITDKTQRVNEIKIIKDFVINAFSNKEYDDQQKEQIVENIIFETGRKIIRDRLVNNMSRIDGRGTHDIRQIDIDLGILPRTHGSVLFTRGETQAIVATTLGTESDAQIIDIPAGESSERFILHYNFPPYCTGEIGQSTGPKRREIGHGNLAKRALLAVIPDKNKFPYVIRVVSEITESNGSSSMASVCGTSLALMEAGVPIVSPVAGIAMGLIKEDDKFVVLTDISGDEDHLGDMDFKIAGTIDGITALQMDIKIDGVTNEIIKIALHQARLALNSILNTMVTAIPVSKSCISDFAPRITTIKINPDKIRNVIGKGGITIRSLVEKTGASIDVQDDGTITIASVDKKAASTAKMLIEEITAEVEVGKIYAGKITKIMDFGAVVTFLSNKDGLVHISQISTSRIKNIHDHLKEGQKVQVKIIEIDRLGKIRLSIKDAL